MRIITGTARGINLDTLEGLETRPTAERVKEALFSMIQFDIEGRNVLDLFGGSGQLALEALSRGALKATIVDASRDAIDIINTNCKKTKLDSKCRVTCSDYASFLKYSANEKYGLIFLDPPYASDMIQKALRIIRERDLLMDGGVIVCETEVPEEERNKKKEKKLSKEEQAQKDSAQILSKVFGYNRELFEQYSIDKTNFYGRTRLTLLSFKK